MGGFLQKKREEEKKKRNDMLLNQWGKTAGGQEEFQIFDKHVKAVKPGLVIMPSLLLPRRRKGINFSDPPSRPKKRKEKKNVLRPGLKIPFRMARTARL